MTAEEALVVIDDWTNGMPAHSQAGGWQKAAKVLAEEVRRLNRAYDALLEKYTGEPHINGWPLTSGLPKKDGVAPESATG